MNRLYKGTILFASLLLLLSCGGPKDGKANSYAEAQGKPDSTAIHDSLSEVKKTVVSVSEKRKKTSGFPEWILISLVLAEAVCIVYEGVKLKKIREDVSCLESRLSRHEIAIKRFETDMIKKIEKELAGSKSKTPYNTPQKPRQNSLREQETMAKKPIQEPIENNIPVQPPATVDSDCAFLKHFKDGILEVASKEQAFFQVTFEVGGKDGSFEFIGDVRKAIANKNSILDDVCETINFKRDATQIITDKWGKCIKQQDGRWLVTQKAILSFK